MSQEILRDEIARAIFVARSWQTGAVGDWDEVDEAVREVYGRQAEAVLAIPRLQEALSVHARVIEQTEHLVPISSDTGGIE